MRRRRRSPAEAEVDMTPMLDIVFILLIFFIVTAVFVQEKTVSMQPPPPGPPPTDEADPVILVQINKRNIIFVKGTMTDLPRVGPAIEALRADNGKSAVLIKPEDEAEHGVVVSVFEAAKNTGAHTIIQRDRR